MQGRKLFTLSALTILIALCFISVPGVAGDHPWDIDNGDDNRDIRDVDLPDGTEAKSIFDFEPTEGAPGLSASLSVLPPVVQLAADYIYRSWITYSTPSVSRRTVVQPKEISRSKRSIR